MKVELPEKGVELFFDAPGQEVPRYRVGKGGRGSAKSHSAARALIIKGTQKPLRWLCAREMQNSIEESVHKLLSDVIDELGLRGFYDVKQRTISSRRGGEIIFEGLHRNVTKIKSMEGLDGAWVEEAERVAKDSWKVLTPTIRKPGSEIWVTYNPDLATDATHTMFTGGDPGTEGWQPPAGWRPPPRTRLVTMNWEDNPWFPDELREEKDHLYSVDPDAADWVWGGQCRKNSKAAIFHGKWRIENLDAETLTSDAQGPYYGADWGFSTDPTAAVRVWIIGRQLYIQFEAYKHHVEMNDLCQLFKDCIPGAMTGLFRADNARPETISHLRNQYGMNIEPCEKWTGSVEDGIAFLRQFDAIVIHPRCVNTIQEARLYSYKVDKNTGDVLTDIVDKWNHAWDAVRYALGPMIKAGDSMLEFYRRGAEAKREADAERAAKRAKENPQEQQAAAARAAQIGAWTNGNT